jgi:hypothetical protein
MSQKGAGQSDASSILLWQVYKGICRCQRGDLLITVYKGDNRSVTVRRCAAVRCQLCLAVRC